MKYIKNWELFVENLNEKYHCSLKTPMGEIFLYKNPESLISKSENIRGFILKNGDFFIFDGGRNTNCVIHQDGLEVAYELNIIKDKPIYKDWGLSEPKEFVCVQRNPNTAEFYISESYMDSTIKKYYSTFKIFVDNAQNKAKLYNNTLLFFATSKLDTYDKIPQPEY